MVRPLPRFALAAPTSGAGKTTVAFGLMAALGQRGLDVAPFKVGPDYIDPGYHALATGRPGRNLDAWLCGSDLLAPLLLHGAAGADVAVIEGVMGLYDGKLGEVEGRRGFGSTAHVAGLVGAPVVLVVDAAHSSRTAAAVAHGLAVHPDAPRVCGVILNRVGSPRALAEVTDALAQVELPLLGAIPRSTDLVVPSRHLGLVPAAERDAAQAVVDSAAALVS
ncbi:MAG: cobyrinate a,c-diamide synthase, partial [Propionibacteriaceae bacterium]|nr:cobyrinate a,c-diamide synthase [Propionibacteriaceae bacterium]